MCVNNLIYVKGFKSDDLSVEKNLSIILPLVKYHIIKIINDIKNKVNVT